tara:strand:+ start:34288 stop:34542 length:255 start_codon:yes stop_codon:yes gene_type:complete
MVYQADQLISKCISSNFKIDTIITKGFIELMSNHIKNRNGSTQVDYLYIENELNCFLSEEEIKSADITKEINISVVSTVNVNIK